MQVPLPDLQPFLWRRGGAPNPIRVSQFPEGQGALVDTPGHTRPEEVQDDAKVFDIGGVDGNRTRELRRDRRKE